MSLDLLSLKASCWYTAMLLDCGHYICVCVGNSKALFSDVLCVYVLHKYFEII